MSSILRRDFFFVVVVVDLLYFIVFFLIRCARFAWSSNFSGFSEELQFFYTQNAMLSIHFRFDCPLWKHYRALQKMRREKILIIRMIQRKLFYKFLRLLFFLCAKYQPNGHTTLKQHRFNVDSTS